MVRPAACADALVIQSHASTAHAQELFLTHPGAAFCLCGIILASEKPVKGVLWSLGCCLLGTPVCCMWVISRLTRGRGSLRLID
mmetsp:Transcript_43890/g.99240  ORF Transcript_43890/g.99240 Transcript_43890/m.99240 type:complete len:84 (-) Transcript_43890:462-713(-)